MLENCLEGLNDEQRKAAESLSGPLLIIAGAGTGKTKTLTARTANAIDSGIRPERILLLTFTNKAADEMKERVVRAVGEGGRLVTACTFHSWCNAFLRGVATRYGFSTGFGVVNASDANDLMKPIREAARAESGAREKEFPTVKDVMGVRSMSVVNMIQTSEVVKGNPDLDCWKTEVESILEQYAARKLKRDVMDYDDLMYFAWSALVTDEDLRNRVDESYDLVMCDEYQDTDVMQDAILNLITRNRNDLCVVGDDNQSIYSFRGAKISNILTFRERHGAEQVVLDRNYRSTKQILDLANAVMATSAKEGIEKYLRGGSEGERPALVRCSDRRAEAKYVAGEIVARQKRGENLRDVGVIFRYANQSYELEKELNKLGVPYVKFGGPKFFDREQVKVALGFLRAAGSDKDDLGWATALAAYPGVGDMRSAEYAEMVLDGGLDALTGEGASGYAWSRSLAEARSAIERMRGGMTLQEQIAWLIDDYLPDLERRTVEASRIGDKPARMKQIREGLEDAAALKEMTEGYASPRSFLSDVVLAAREPEKDGDYVNLTTIHSAKGLEYDEVFLLSPLQGTFPRTIEDSPEDREELRCLYVALTRAKRRLTVTFPQTAIKTGKPERTVLSHHVTDAAVETMDVKGSAYSYAWSGGYGKRRK